MILRHPRRATIIAVCISVLSVGPVAAQVPGPQPWWPTQPRPLPFLHPLFADDAVLQRDVPIPVWGWSTPGDRVRVSVDGEPNGAVAVADASGRWEAKIGPFPAGGPHVLSAKGATRSAAFRNVLFGDVWLCSGQSNMNWPLRVALDGEREVKAANHPAIRSFTVGFYPSLVPQQLPPPAKWEVCTPEAARQFSAVGYFFARQIHETQKVPVGLLHSSAGATAAEAWTSGDALRKQMPFDYRERLAELDRQVAATGGPEADYFQRIEQWLAVADPMSAKQKYASDPNLDAASWLDIAVPKPWQEAGLKDHHGLVWFRRTVDLPDAWAGKEIVLHMSVVNDADVMWFNGTLVGAMQTPGTHRTYRVDGSLVKPGKNLLAAAVVSKAGPSGFCSAPANMVARSPSVPNAPSLRLDGLWKAKASAKFADLPSPMPEPAVGNYKTITSLHNGMIAPLTPFAIKGALWYQGESNWPHAMLHRRLLPTLIADWRGRFGREFPFLIVSLAGYNPLQTKPVEPGWAEIRESQWRTTRKVPNTGLAVAIDIGDANDIHPRNKQEVGRRLALVARNRVYGETSLVYSGPEFTEMMPEPGGKAIRLYFRHIGAGLAVKIGDAKLRGFAIAGADKQFVWADAIIEDNTVVVSSPDVAAPTTVRYGWASNPIGNLFNKDGLPAIPFRTDE